MSITAGVLAQSPGNTIRISEVFRNAPLSKAFKTIELKFRVQVAYDNSLIQGVIVSLKLENADLDESMTRLLQGTSLTFQRVGENIVILPAPPGKNTSPPADENVTVTGQVIDDETGETLPHATLQVSGTFIATTTNKDGHFSLFKIPSDTASLHVRYLGYISRTIPVSTCKGSNNCMIRLRSDSKILNEVVVLDEYNQAMLIDGNPGSAVFNPQALNNVPSLGEQDVNRTLQLLPGITATDETSAGMVIRGSHSSYNLTLLDGMTIYQQDHLFGAYSIINSDVIKDARVQKGMFDAKYGGRASGVMDITTKSGNSNKPAFTATANLINGKATAELPLGKNWSFFISGRRSVTDALQSRLFEKLFDIARSSNDHISVFGAFSNSGKPNPAYLFFDANSKLSFRPSPRDIVSLTYYVSRDAMDIEDSVRMNEDGGDYIVHNNERTRWGNNGISLRWARQWTDRYYSVLRISDSKFFRRFRLEQEHKLNSEASLFLFRIENTISDFSYAIDNEFIFRENYIFEWGVSGVRQEAVPTIGYKNILSNGVDEEVVEDTEESEYQQSWMHSLYGTIRLNPIAGLSLSLGSRFVHYYNNNNSMHIEPRATAVYTLNENLKIKAAYGRSNQFITQAFYNSEYGSTSGLHENFWLLADPQDIGYPVITSDHISGGAMFKRNGFTYDAEIYYKSTTGVIIDEDRNSGNTRAYGIDIALQKTFGIHKGWIAYSLAQCIQRHPYILGGKWTPSWQDQRHEVKVVNMITLGRWNLSASLIYGSGKPYPRYTVRYSRNEDNLVSRYDKILDYRNRYRIPAYFRMDAAATYNIRLSPFVNIDLGLSIHNLTDHQNIKTRRLDSAKLDQALPATYEPVPSYRDVLLLGFSPSLFASISF